MAHGIDIYSLRIPGMIAGIIRNELKVATVILVDIQAVGPIRNEYIFDVEIIDVRPGTLAGNDHLGFSIPKQQAGECYGK